MAVNDGAPVKRPVAAGRRADDQALVMAIGTTRVVSPVSSRVVGRNVRRPRKRLSRCGCTSREVRQR